MRLRNFTLLLLIMATRPVYTQTFTEILGRPTNNSVTMSFLPDQPTDVYWEYGTSPGIYVHSSTTFSVQKDSVLTAIFPGLLPDTRYYYRSRYRASGTISFSAGTEHMFHTQRPRGSTFTFAIEADPHLDTNSNPAAYALTLQNILSKQPDFMIDLGDIFMSEKLPVINQTEITNRHLLYRHYFDAVCPSVPLFLALGNHEGELGWMLNGTSNSLPVMASNTRKYYYPNPLPDSFYSGDTKPEPFVGLRENYYAWEWGDALFIVLDPFWYTLSKPDWGWTLGTEQYAWFKEVITGSKAKFKFVFCHNLLGGKGNDARGGAEYAGMFEMGGHNQDSTWGFGQSRPGWEKPVHSLMIENPTTIFFHGHDHFFGMQEKDGMVYQEVPQPSNRNITNISASQYGYVDGIFMPGRGFLLVTVSDTATRVDYIKTYLANEENAAHHNGETAYSYQVFSSANGINDPLVIPVGITLDQNFPNPFNKETTISYSLPAANHIQVKVFDVLGRESMTVVDQYQQAGKYSFTLNQGKPALSPGVYFYSIKADHFSRTMKMICN
ncbi:MAG: T9SS type A sorting domain-containing protein [Bacteroidota bacterium]